MTDRKRFAVLNGGVRGDKPTTEDSQKCFEVLSGGLETTVQDYRGREGYFRFGVPRSGPMDPLSFQLGNQLLGNDENAAGLEIQFIGPTLRFFGETVIAITGANNHPQLNQKPLSLWRTIPIQPGDVLSFGHAEVGARSYITLAGGIDLPLVMGSRSTFTKAQLGGFQGRKLMAGDVIYTFPSSQPLHQLFDRAVPKDSQPEFSHRWRVDVLLGPHDDGLTPDDIHQFLNYDWLVSPKSDRIGYRLEGPKFQFSETLRSKSAKNGSHPSNRIDYGCSIGSVLLCGHTPTVLLADCPSLTGYMTPFTVMTHSLRQVGQARPGDIINFRQAALNHPHTSSPLVELR